MHWFCKPSASFCAHLLHLFIFRSTLWKECLKFRELLRSNNDLATKYANLRRKLVAIYREDHELYI
jgi:GrpB-like predicted nucleotidyltransferase (UPF0157 family)